MNKTSSIFYFDEKLIQYEKKFEWNDALNYLENLYKEHQSIQIVNTLIGFSWYYLIEGGVDSGRYENDDCKKALVLWKKYLDIGEKNYYNDSYYNFIAGYTLSLHGFYINQEYERKSIVFMKNSVLLAENAQLKKLTKHFLNNSISKKYIPLKNANEIRFLFFGGESLLDKYFFSILK